MTGIMSENFVIEKDFEDNDEEARLTLTNSGKRLKKKIREEKVNFHDNYLLDISIEKFNLMLQYVREKNISIWWNGVGTCPLCWKYWYEYNCEGCPIGNCCENTPYDDVHFAQISDNIEGLVEAFREEINFLYTKRGFVKF